MIHVGEPSFFKAVYEDACDHDVILIEGVHSPIVRRITRTYRWIGEEKRLNLVVQKSCRAWLNAGRRSFTPT